MKTVLVVLIIGLSLTISARADVGGNIQSEEPQLKSSRPSWTNNTERQVLGGDIIQTSSGEASTRELAIFKARNAAVKLIVDECGVAHRDIVPRKQYVETTGNGFRAYQSMSLAFNSCDEGKRAWFKSRYENKKLAEEQALYDKMLKNQISPNEMTDERVAEIIRNERSVVDQEIQGLKDDVEYLKNHGSNGSEKETVVERSSGSGQKQCWEEVGYLENELRSDVVANHYMSDSDSHLFNKIEAKKAQCARMMTKEEVLDAKKRAIAHADGHLAALGYGPAEIAKLKKKMLKDLEREEKEGPKKLRVLNYKTDNDGNPVTDKDGNDVFVDENGNDVAMEDN